MKLTSSDSVGLCTVPGYYSPSEYAGGRISLNQNGVSKAIIPAGFEDFEYCFQVEDIDIENDKFQLQLLDDNGNYDSVSLDEFHFRRLKMICRFTK